MRKSAWVGLIIILVIAVGVFAYSFSGNVQLGPKARSQSENIAPYKVFVTSLNFSGGELFLADNLCQQIAKKASLPGRYTAWLSTSTKDAKDKIPDGRYVRVDGLFSCFSVVF